LAIREVENVMVKQRLRVPKLGNDLGRFQLLTSALSLQVGGSQPQQEALLP